MAEQLKTEDLENQLSDVTKLSDFLEENNEQLIPNTELSEYLGKLIEESGCKKSDIIKQTNLNRAYVYQIFEGKKQPSRDKLISIAIGMGLDFEHVQKLLKYAGMRHLYARDMRDASIIFAVKRGYTFNETNCTLYEQGLKILE